MTTKKSKRQKPQPFDFLALPLVDGTFGLGEFIGAGAFGAKVCVLYSLRESSPEALRDRLESVMLADVVGLFLFATREIERGEWLVIGSHAPSKRAYLASLPSAGDTSYTGEVAEEFLGAYHSLRPWDCPEWFRAILLPHLEPPPQDRVPALTLEATEAIPASRAEPGSVPAGPAQVHVTITYKGEGLPSASLLRSRQSVEAWIEAEHLGEVTDAGGGGGVMDIFVDASNAREAVAAIRVKVAQMGWGARTEIDVEPLDEDN